MFKFLDPTGATYYASREFVYSLPRRGQRWSDWTEHPDPAEPDGKAYGPGRLHIMKRLDVTQAHAPQHWCAWLAEGRGLIGEDEYTAAFQAVRLRRIAPTVLWRALRSPFNWGCSANLSRIDLHKAKLHGADLSGANLYEADLGEAILCRANLREADLREADLSGSLLYKTDLYKAQLCWADLRGADLRGANLSEADLRLANLGWTNLDRADLRGADLRGANLDGANLPWRDQ